MKTRTIILCALYTALTAIGAFIRIPFPLVPITLQTLFVVMSGLFLGAKGGAISQLVYVLIGLVGVPIFTQGGGIGYILKPTFGYLLGFIAGAYLTGIISEKLKKNRFIYRIIASFGGLGIIYFIGIIYLYFIKRFYLNLETGIAEILYTGIIVCLPADIFSCMLASFLAVKIKKYIRCEKTNTSTSGE